MKRKVPGGNNRKNEKRKKTVPSEEITKGR
jgi:hypothetical protein